MSAENVEQEEVEALALRATKYPNFRVASGGKGPPDPPEDDTNWLADYLPGTTFVSMRRNSKDCDLELFHVMFNTSEVCLLKWELPDGKVWDKYVTPTGFSKLMKPGIILGVVKLIEKEPGTPGNEDTND